MPFTVNQNSGCSPTLNPTSVSVGATLIPDLQFQIQIAQGCAWTLASNDSWITLNSASSGSGTSIVSLRVEANSGAARSGTVTVEGQTFTVNQAGGCTTALLPTSVNVPAPASSGLSFSLQASQFCPWSVSSNAGWLTVTSASTGTGPATVTFNVAANSGPARSGTITAGGVAFTVNQASGCVYLLEPSSASLGQPGVTNATFLIQTGAGCPWTITPAVDWISVSSPASGNGPATVTYTVRANFGLPRTGTLDVSGATFTVSQAACSGYTVDPTSFNLGGEARRIRGSR
jgi:hypothetical protein